MWKLVAFLLLFCGVLLAPSNASAADFQVGGHGIFGNPWGLYIGAPAPAPQVYVYPPVYIPAPIYVEPVSPVYVVPAPVYAQPLYVHPTWSDWYIENGVWTRRQIGTHLGIRPYRW